MSHKAIAKTAGVIGFATFASRVLGFLRDVVIAKFFGTALFAQAFIVAFRIPNLLRDVVGEGAANAAFVPVLSEYRVKKTQKEYWELAGVLFKLLSLILLVLTVLGMLFAPLIVRAMAPGFMAEPVKYSITVKLTRIIFPYIFLIGLTAYAMGVLNSLKHFAVPAWGPSLLNVAMILCAVYLGPRLKEPVYALAIGVILGGVLQLFLNVPVMLSKGFSLKGRIDFAHPGAKKVVKLLLPRILGTGIYQLSAFVDTIMASLSGVVGEGGVAALYYANRVIQFPMAIFGVSLAQAALPTMSDHASLNDHEELRRTVSFALRGILLIMVPSCIGLLVLARPIVKALFERGAFDAYSVNITTSVLFFYAFGLFAYAGIKVLVSSFYSMQDTITPVKTASAALCVNVVLNLILMFPLKVGGIALATSLAASFNFAMLAFILRRRIGGIDGRRMLGSFLRILCASLAMGLTVNIAAACMPAGLFSLSALLALAVIVFIAGSFILRVREMEELFKWASKRR